MQTHQGAMTVRNQRIGKDLLPAKRRKSELSRLTRSWGGWDSVSLYLDRCQVATPETLVAATWRHVEQLRPAVGTVIDFGAGDGRFARLGTYRKYIGYEIDMGLCSSVQLPRNAQLKNQCAFTEEVKGADLCIGNPPFVRNQDLPLGWRQHASSVLEQRTGVILSGLANAWQYFFLLALASLKKDGLCALVLPYEWVSRPSAQAIRDYISEQGWSVNVYRLVDTTFNSVLTTSSITIVDKASSDGTWSYFEETSAGEYSRLVSPSGGKSGVIEYLSRSATSKSAPHAVRGLSPGTQKVLTLSEGERVRSGLKIGSDVVRCITTMRHVPVEVMDLDPAAFNENFRDTGQKCWLIRTDNKPSVRVDAYLKSVSKEDYQTATCLQRDEWWKFRMPPIPQVLISMSFQGTFPKAVRNTIEARAVGGVYGIYNVNKTQARKISAGLDGLDIRERVVAHSNGLRKLEISQLNSLLVEAFDKKRGVRKEL